MGFRRIRSLAEEEKALAARQEKRRKERIKKALGQALKWGGALAGLAIVLAALITWAGPVRLSNLTDAFAMLGRRGEGFPLEISYGNLKQAAMLDKQLLLAGPTTLDIYNRGRYLLHQLEQPFDTPMLRIRGGRALLFDRGASKFTLMSRSETLYEKDAGQTILCMDLGRQGTVAVGSKAETGTSEARVWDPKEKLLFAWNCEKEYIAAMRLAGNGKSLAMCLTGTQQAGVYSRFVNYTFHKKEPTVNLSFENCWLYRVEPMSGGWFALGDQALYLIRRNGTTETLSYDGRSLELCAAGENGALALALQDWGKNSSLLRVYDRKGALLLEQSFTRPILSLECYGGAVYLQLDGLLLRWKKNGGFVQSQPLPQGTQQVYARGRDLYVLTIESVELLKPLWEELDGTLLRQP